MNRIGDGVTASGAMRSPLSEVASVHTTRLPKKMKSSHDVVHAISKFPLRRNVMIAD
jgi:hypothetical protein